MPRTKFKGYRNFSKLFFETPADTPGWMDIKIEDKMSNEEVLAQFKQLYGGSKITISRLHSEDRILYDAMRKRGLLRHVHRLR